VLKTTLVDETLSQVSLEDDAHSGHLLTFHKEKSVAHFCDKIPEDKRMMICEATAEHNLLWEMPDDF